MTDDVKLSYSSTFRADVEQSFDELLPFDLISERQGYARQGFDNIEGLLVR